MSGLTLAALAIASAAIAMVLMIRELHLRALDARVSHVIAGEAGSAAPFDLSGWLSTLGARYRRFYPAEDVEELRTILQSAGFNPYRATSTWIGVKVLSMTTAPLVAALVADFLGKSLMTVLVFALVGLVIGLMGPRLILTVMKMRFASALRNGTADAIDLLVVCTEAGMGLESALERVSEEMHRSNPAISNVLRGLLDDLQILPNRRDAFERMGATSEALRRFGAMMAQSLQYGTPLGQALRNIAHELRRESITKLEERAHKLGVKLTVPMVMFMLPAMFVILGGSSFLHLIRAFKGI
jgi:tight adherence protein C